MDLRSWSRGAGFLGAFVVLSAACSSSSDTATGGVPADQAVTALRGTLKGTSGQALSGVTVTAGGVSATSNAQGRFELLAPAGNAVVRFVKAGYVDGFRSVSLIKGRPTQLDVALLALAPPVPIDAVAGGTVNGSRSAGVIIPANAFVDASGKAVTGMVDVYLTPLDPGVPAERDAAPGFVAESAGTASMLESFGMADITVKQGETKLSVGSGKELELRIPAPAALAQPEPTIPLWSFDENKGVWVPEGTGTYEASSKTYVGKAKHMSIWNVDKAYLATCVCGLVKEKGNGPLPGARIDANGVSYFGTSSANAELDGKFCIAVRKDSDVSVTAYHKSGGGQARTVKSGNADTKIPAEIGDARCIDVGVWEVERDVFVDSSGKKVACGEIGNPFAGGCAEAFGTAMGGCFKPEGTCVAKVEAGGATTRYSNGAYVQSSAGESKYFSSTGQLCATSTFDLSGASAGGSFTIRYTLPDGRVFTMIIADEGRGDMVITCPGGAETRVTPDQRAALEACSGGGGDASQECTTEGLPDAGSGVPTVCVDDTTCNGNVCCAIPDSSEKLCLPAATCNAIPR